MNPVITTNGDAAKNHVTTQKNAADVYLNTIKYKNADTFHNTTVNKLAVTFLNTTVFKNAKCAKNGFAIANANMFLNTTGNITALHKTHAAHHKLQQLLAADSNKQRLNNSLFNCKSGEGFSPDFFLTLPFLINKYIINLTH